MAKEIILAHIYHVSIINTFRGENANSSLTYAKKEYFTESDIKKEVLLNWIKSTKKLIERDFYKEKNATIKDFELKGIEVKYKGTDRWWLTWFCHETYCHYDTEQEMFDDFESFLKEKGVHLGYGGGYDGYVEPDGAGNKYCAMGAEDYWRWKHCDCDGCKKFGRTIISH